MEALSSALNLHITQKSSDFCHLQVTIPADLVDTVYHTAANSQREKIAIPGFPIGNAPLAYIAHNYNVDLTHHAQEFLFNYFVHSFLLNEIRRNKLIVLGNPRLIDVHVKPHTDAHYIFETSLQEVPKLQNWKHFPFKAPRRKNYRDIDRQVESFIKEETNYFDQMNHTTIAIGDWVNFHIWLADKHSGKTFEPHKENLWLKIGDEMADAPFQEFFIGKKKGDQFCIAHACFQNYFSEHMNHKYTYCIEVQEVIPTSYFCLQSLKKHFRIKTNKDMHKKLIEVFSFRNDISQRRLTAEGSLKLLIKHHPIILQEHALLRQQQTVLHTLQDNPDYPVYKAQPDFKDYINKLAHKQMQEMIIIDAVGYEENITVNHEDLYTYLNLMNRVRTKEFIYFESPKTKINGQETPIPNKTLEYYCFREKTLNHIIYHLTKH
ncbi:MAG: trigger factor [Candidatus Babeliales bacterium]